MRSLKFSRQVICLTCHSDDNCDFHLMLSMMCLRIHFRRLLIYKSKYKRLHFKMEFPSIILPAGSEFAYCKVFASFFSISLLLGIQVTVFQHCNCKLELCKHAKPSLSPKVPSGLQNVPHISNIQVSSLFGRAHFKKKEIQKMWGISGVRHTLDYVSRRKGLGLLASIQISVWMWPLCSEVRRVYVYVRKINGPRTASKDVSCRALRSQHPLEGNAYPRTCTAFLYPRSCSNFLQGPRQQGDTSATFFITVREQKQRYH